jgi:hypothetical protein
MNEGCDFDLTIVAVLTSRHTWRRYVWHGSVAMMNIDHLIGMRSLHRPGINSGAHSRKSVETD